LQLLDLPELATDLERRQKVYDFVLNERSFEKSGIIPDRSGYNHFISVQSKLLDEAQITELLVDDPKYKQTEQNEINGASQRNACLWRAAAALWKKNPDIHESYNLKEMRSATIDGKSSHFED
jgi:hypothetical protein